MVSRSLVAFLHLRRQDRIGHLACMGVVLSRENAPARISGAPPSPATNDRVLEKQRWLNSNRVPTVDVLGWIMTD